MFDQEADAMSMYSRSSRMPSLVMEPGQSMQEYYAMLQAQAHDLNAANAQRVGAAARPRRNSGSSVMSETERMYGWSGSRGGIANEPQSGPRYIINKEGHLVLASNNDDEEQHGKKNRSSTTTTTTATSSPLAGNAATAAKPALRTARSDGTKPMYRPAFAPSADLPPSSDEEVEELDEDDRVIQHDLPSTRPLKPRTSLKQKLGSLVARVGSVRRGGAHDAGAGGAATTPSPPAVSDSNSKANGGNGGDYLSVKRAATSAAAYGRRNNASGSNGVSRPNFARKGSSLAKEDATVQEGDETENSTTATAGTGVNKAIPQDSINATPIVTFTQAEGNEENIPPSHPPTASSSKGHHSSSDREDNGYLDPEGGPFGGFVGLARKLSRRATTGGGRARSRSVPRNLRDEREKQTDQLADKAAAEEMLKSLAKIPLYKPPRSAHVRNAKPLSSFPPRAPLKTTNESGSLANAPRYSYYQRPLKDADGPRVRSNGVDRANTTGGGQHRSSNSYSRGRSGSTPSTYSSFSSTSGVALLAGQGHGHGSSGGAKIPSTLKESSLDGEEDDDIPPVPPVPMLLKDGTVANATRDNSDGKAEGGAKASVVPARPSVDETATAPNWTVFKKDSQTSLNKS